MFSFVASLIVSYVISVVLAPKPPNVKPPGFNEIQLPEAREGKEVPVLFGCRKLKGYNTVWYGDYRTTAIKSKGGKK